MAEQNLKPTGYVPVGWHFRSIFVDDDGSVFRRGKYCPEEKGSMQFTSRQTDEQKAQKEKGEQVGSEQEQATDAALKAPVVPEGVLPKELVDKLIAIFTDELREKKEEAIREFKESLEKSKTSMKEDVAIGGGMTPNELGQAIALGEQYKKGGVHYKNVKDLDPRDFNKEGVTFTCYGTGYLIVDDVRQGQPVTTPYGRIFRFKFQASRITRVGRVESYSSFCSIRVHSNKEIEWLRAHSLYNIEFYEDTKLALDADVQIIPIAAKIYRQISSLDQPQVLKRAEQYNVPIGGDLRDIIQRLALAMAKEELRRIASNAETRNVESLESKILG